MSCAHRLVGEYRREPGVSICREHKAQKIEHQGLTSRGTAFKRAPNEGQSKDHTAYVRLWRAGMKWAALGIGMIALSLPLTAANLRVIILSWNYPIDPVPTNIVFDLYFTTNLNTTNWIIYSSTTNHVVKVRALEPSAFFRLKVRDSATGTSTNWTINER